MVIQVIFRPSSDIRNIYKDRQSAPKRIIRHVQQFLASAEFNRPVCRQDIGGPKIFKLFCKYFFKPVKSLSNQIHMLKMLSVVAQDLIVGGFIINNLKRFIEDYISLVNNSEIFICLP